MLGKKNVGIYFVGVFVVLIVLERLIAWIFKLEINAISQFTPVVLLMLGVVVSWPRKGWGFMDRGGFNNELRVWGYLASGFLSLFAIVLAMQIISPNFNSIPRIPDSIITSTIAEYQSEYAQIEEISIDVDQDEKLIIVSILGEFDYQQAKEHGVNFSRSLAQAATRTRSFVWGPLNDYYGDLWSSYSLSLYVRDTHSDAVAVGALSGGYQLEWEESQ